MYFPLPTTPYHHRDFYRLAAFCLTLLIGLPALAQSGADVGNPAGSSADAFSTASDSTASKRFLRTSSPPWWRPLPSTRMRWSPRY